MLGYRKPNEAQLGASPIVINPTGSEEDRARGIVSKKVPIAWSQGDQLVVLRQAAADGLRLPRRGGR